MSLLIHVQLFGTPCTVACQASLSMEFSRQEDWNGLLFPTPQDCPDPEMEPEFLHLLRWQIYPSSWDFPHGTSGKEPAYQCRRHDRLRFDPEWGRSPGGGHGNLLQYSCLEKQSLVGYSPWDCKESDMTEAT
ncbi:unnamed protein product [Rangifer tarandus platyrhynchus]|uniref:Uncharacterized protein n=2 Tax=Rangifer tarandus platyrhynchus TaxID=3082113 RepID=A0AC60A335_RANTA|nr:unnamed protein product [Rangifer tarandus platyrhynchus]